MKSLWDIEPHTLAKHEILKRYLDAWFPILAKYNERIVYLDGFCGPGRYKGGEDGSPIIAIKQALKHFDRLENREIKFIFVDERQDRIEHLRNEISLLAIPTNFSIETRTSQFEHTITQILDDLNSNHLNLEPTFAFVDPFGFKGVPYTVIKRLLLNPKTEILINIMAEFINRFVEHPDANTRQHIVDLFGTNESLDIISSSDDRLNALRQLYQAQLETCAKYVRYFEMRDSKNQVIYYLFFATNHPLGFVKMKEAFWKVDSQSGFYFSDATNPSQMILLSLDPSEDLAKIIQNEFSGKRKNVFQIRFFVEEKTSYTAKHMRHALALLEIQNKIVVSPTKTDGKKRPKGTFCDTVNIQFL